MTNLDYSTGAGYIFQWTVSLYIYTLLKNDEYEIDNSRNLPEDFKEFRKNILLFKDKCILKYGGGFSANTEIMLEGDGKCFEDINLLSENNSGIHDNLIFIQVKTKGGNKTITKADGVLKSIKNFIQNINFQKDKGNNNFLFFILSNTKLSPALIKNITTHNVNFYISMIDYIIKDNNKRTSTINLDYPNMTLNNIGGNSIITEELIIYLKDNDITDLDYQKYINLYNIDYITKLYKLIKDLKLILNNLVLIRSIKIELLITELINTYGKTGDGGYLDRKDQIEKLSVDVSEIKNVDEKFNLYKKFLYTFFSSEDGGKMINQLDSISKGKFI